ncbi:hypothetical protein F4604DRAFT_1929839 [Suillus subluteus]|nr:hypothetical protein F4604DRAFT_1929839 [Suillus subluteus]
MSTARATLRRAYSGPTPPPSSPLLYTAPNLLFPKDDDRSDDIFTKGNSPPHLTAEVFTNSSGPDSDFDSDPAHPLTPESRRFDLHSLRNSPSPVGPSRSSKRAAGYQPYVKRSLHTRSLHSTREQHRFANLIRGRVSDDSSDSETNDTDLDIFSRGMRSFNQEGVCRILAFKEAEREHKRALYEAYVWELEVMKMMKGVIEHVNTTEKELWERSADEAEVLRRLLAGCDENQVSENIDHLTAIRPKQQSKLNTLDHELDELKEHALRTGLPIFTSEDEGVVADAIRRSPT